MKILALDCTANSASCVICDDKKISASAYTDSARKHSETLAPMIERIFSDAALDISDIDLFACNAGPGSFTGVRIGVAQIKGLAFGREKPCIPISTLESLAHNMLGFAGIICPVMDARRNQLYCALFESDGNEIKRLCADTVLSVDELKEKLDAFDKPIYIVGDGYDIAHKIENENICDTPELLIHQNAWSTAYCALKIYNSVSKEALEDFTDRKLTPIYLRLSQAERCRNENTKS